MDSVAITGAGGTVAAFWSWWTRELGAAALAVAGPLRRTGGGFVLELSGGGATLRRATPAPDAGPDASTVLARGPRGADGMAALGRHRGPVDVRLADDLVLRKTVEVPAVAAADLRGLLTFEMDRQTPFAPADIHFDFVVAGRTADGERLRVELAVVLHREIAAALAVAEAAGLAVRSLAPAEPGGAAPRFHLLPHDRRRHRPRAVPLAAAAGAVLLAAAVGAGLYRQAAATAAAQAELATLRAAAEATAALRDRVVRLDSLDRRLRARKAGEPSFLDVLRELTDTLPDDTWLTRLTFTEGRLDVAGASRTASALVGALEERALFTQARFRAPLTLDPGSGIEQFQISLRVPGEGGRP